MPVLRFVSPFAPLAMTLEEKEELVHVSDQAVGECMALYEKFLWQDKSRLDPAMWTPIRERDNMRAFLNRTPGGGTGNRDMHMLLLLGTIAGTLDDAMYGVLNPTHKEFRIKSTYVGDTMLDMAILESILQPTPDHPYESMTVRWLVKGVPLIVRLVAKHQDSVYVETTGIRQLSNGERVGVHLFHSVSFDKTPVLPQYTRFNMSLMAVYRQHGPDKVQAFSTCYFELKESFKVSMVVKAMAEAVLSVSQIVECGQLKKLAWLVQNKAVLSGDDAGGAMQDGCSVCGSHDRSARRGLKSACAICAKYTCSKCRVKRTLSLFAPDGQLIKHQMRFCVPCVSSAKRLDAAAVAKDDAERGLGLHARSYQASTSSASSPYSSDEMWNQKYHTAPGKRSVY